jgi:hypothetical protein
VAETSENIEFPQMLCYLPTCEHDACIISLKRCITYLISDSALHYTNNECLRVQWYEYFHEVKDGMFHSTIGDSRVEWNIPSFTE